MKIIHGALSGLLAEVTAAAPGATVRVAALMQSTVQAPAAPLYATWVVVTAMPDGGAGWLEWRHLVGRQHAEISGRDYVVPPRLVRLTDERLAEVRERVRGTGLAVADGIVADGAETADGVLD